MFGINMKITHNNVVVFLRPLTKNDLPTIVDRFASLKVHLFTMGLFAQTLENEEEWYEKRRDDSSSCYWAIQPEGHKLPIGVTSLHGINSTLNSSSSGIIIWDQDWWGKRVASTTHLGRTLFAADYLNRFTINSCVRVPNNASRRALERVGYTIWGTEPVDDFKQGVWIDTHHLKWIHPDRVKVLFPGGVPERYWAGIERAKIALELARRVVEFP